MLFWANKVSMCSSAQGVALNQRSFVLLILWGTSTNCKGLCLLDPEKQSDTPGKFRGLFKKSK